MNPVSQSKFAKMIGVSPQFMPKIAARLTWVKVKGKKKEQVDLHGSHTLSYLAQRESDQKQVKIEEPEDEPGEEPEQPKRKTSGLGNNSSGISRSGSRAGTSKRLLEEEKLEEQIEQIRIKNQQIRSFLIPKELVRKLFGRIYAIDENQFKTINVNVTPKISAIYNTANAKKTNEIIELVKEMGVEISEADEKELRSDINKTLESGEPDRILEMNKVLEDATGMILKNIQREIDEFLKLVEELGG